MATYNPKGIARALHGSPFGNRTVFVDKAVITATLTNGDIVRIVPVAGGTLVDRVTLNTPDLDSATQLTGKIGFIAMDGTVLDDDIVVADGAIWRSAGTSAVEIWPPFHVTQDAYLVATITATSAGGTGTVNGKVEGEMIGMK